MRIGELSERTEASPRSIRYYESVGLLTSRRAGNGHRDFDAGAPDQVMKIKLLPRAGLDIADIVAGGAAAALPVPEGGIRAVRGNVTAGIR